MKAPKFYTPSCISCPNIFLVGPFGLETRYCAGFPKGKKKRLPKNGLKRSVASWCPKRISPPACRIYGFKDENAEAMDFMLNHSKDAKERSGVYVSEHRYKLRCTHPLGLTAKQFWEELQTMPLSQIFKDITLSLGEIVEIDDGHKPYYFYCSSNFDLVPVLLFNASRVISE